MKTPQSTKEMRMRNIIPQERFQDRSAPLTSNQFFQGVSLIISMMFVGFCFIAEGWQGIMAGTLAVLWSIMSFLMAVK